MDISALPSKPASPLSGARDGNDLRKPHEMIVLIPRAKRVTPMSRRVYTALLQVAQARLAAMADMPPADFMFEAPLPGTKAGQIIQVATEGFMLFDRLLRPAQVGVSSNVG